MAKNEWNEKRVRCELARKLSDIQGKMDSALRSIHRMKDRKEEEADLRWSAILLERVRNSIAKG